MNYESDDVIAAVNSVVDVVALALVVDAVHDVAAVDVADLTTLVVAAIDAQSPPPSH